jgi:hypothetical protein
VKRSLREYGELDEATNFIHVKGRVQFLPIPLFEGRKFATFCPYDLREKDEGGELTVTFLDHESLMSLGEYVKRAVQVGSVLRLTQKLKELKHEFDALKGSIDEKNLVIGEQKDRIRTLEKAAGEVGQMSVGATLFTLFTTTLGPSVILALFGVVIAALLPMQTTCVRPLYNVTTRIQIDCLSQLVSPNPLAPYLPVLMVLCGVFIGALLAARRFGVKR